MWGRVIKFSKYPENAHLSRKLWLWLFRLFTFPNSINVGKDSLLISLFFVLFLFWGYFFNIQLNALSLPATDITLRALPVFKHNIHPGPSWINKIRLTPNKAEATYSMLISIIYEVVTPFSILFSHYGHLILLYYYMTLK